jgi:hypothetical protein
MKKVLTMFSTWAMSIFPDFIPSPRRKAFFVIRAKSSLKYRRIYSGNVDESAGVLCDQTGLLTGLSTAKITRKNCEG